MNDFEYKTLLDQRRMTLEELEEYFKILRMVEFERQTLYDMKVRKKILTLIKMLLKIDRIINRRSIKVVGDERYHTNRGKVYVCTSSSDFAIPSLVEVLDELTWTVLPSLSGSDVKTMDFLRRMNLVTVFASKDGREKKIIENRQYKNLMTGGSELIFPEMVDKPSHVLEEGALDSRFVKRVVDARASIVPVAIMDCSKENKTLLYIGKNLEIGELSQEYYSEVVRIVQTDLIDLKKKLVANTEKTLTKIR